MIGVLGDEHLRQQSGGRYSLVDDVRGNRGLREGLALCTRPLASDMALDTEHPRRVIELLADVLTDTLHRTPTGTDGGLGFMYHVGTRQVRRQWRASRGAFRRDALLDRFEGFKFEADGLKVCLEGLVEQLSLNRVQLFTAGGELQALEDRHLVTELIDPELFEHIILTDGGVLLPDRYDFCHQQRSKFPQ